MIARQSGFAESEARNGSPKSRIPGMAFFLHSYIGSVWTNVTMYNIFHTCGISWCSDLHLLPGPMLCGCHNDLSTQEGARSARVPFGEHFAPFSMTAKHSLIGWGGQVVWWPQNGKFPAFAIQQGSHLEKDPEASADHLSLLQWFPALRGIPQVWYIHN